MFLELDFSTSAKIIDTHCHLDSEVFADDLDELLEHSFKNAIDKVIIPAANPQDLSKSVKLCERYKELYFAVGTHPYECDKFDEKLLRELITHKKCVAVGECGFDYYHSKDEAMKTSQRLVFEAQLELACEFQKPVIIHSREANEDTYQTLKKYAPKLVGGVLHCFNASELLLSLYEYNFYFGIGGVLTFKNAKNLVSILPKIPKEKLLLETDAPYLSPEPFRGKRNEPILTHFVASKMAELLAMPRDELIALCTHNAKELFFKENKAS
ncbi:hydrolase TatD [Campylobacter sp. MIT 12-5580]|uniref:TatD family hydrolase n=1 Tax=Campylobacter sp. MIT 12-5580 TaxID=2040651 RepID=UPI0010F5D006|nr:TatD family hydrolase [Campylobacter sp. MIT 12-5580]TKX28945.1 hydrolase TatD [Campylobacter sp. MIT 12-5580]